MADELNGLGHADAADKKHVTVVGIGASAGGLEAFTRLLKNLPGDTGMAFVLIQHLEPTHTSHLTDLLSKSTGIPVTEVRDGSVIEPDHVYVIPPNSNMALTDGILHLTPRGEARGLHLPIDFFLRSLAQNGNGRSVGIILSGTGTDGTLGLAEIKAAGGITFAQDSGSAKFPGMPLSAVAEGCVDLVLPPEGIALELARIAGLPYFDSRAPAENVHPFAGCDEEFARIVELLRGSSGVDFAHYRDTTLKRRIMRRMALGKWENLPDYARSLEGDKAEVKALYQDILIHVTRFFRDPKAFTALSETVLPAIWKAKSPEDTIRVWVAGCATGEEAYSLAITLCELQESRDTRFPLRVFASDISESPSLEKARAGIYPENIEHDVSPDRLLRFFTKEESGYRINKEIRDICIFAKHDVTADPPFAKLDLISCRNVLIYLSAPLQRRIIPSFHYALKDEGFLLLGNSETVGRDTDLFSVVDSQLKIYSRKMATVRLPIFASKGKAADAAERSGPAVRRPTPVDFQQAADRLVIRRFAPPGVLVNKDLDILQFRGRTSPFLEPPQGGSGFNIAVMAQEGLSLEIGKAVRECAKTGDPVIRKNARFMEGGLIRQVNLEVHSIGLSAATEPCFLILFEEVEGLASLPSPAAVRNQRGPPEDEMISLLRSELAAAREYLQAVREQSEAINEELKSSGEEMESSNEELQSTNEELETAKEELQSGNEELATMNEELRTRNLEQAQLNDDLSNLLSAVQIPIMILGGDMRLRRFTPTAGKILQLTSSDVGRPIGTLKFFLPDLDIGKSVTEVVSSQEPSVREIRNQDGRWHALRIHPYRSSDGKIDGVVVVLLDIDEIKLAQQRLQESGDYARAIVDTVRDPLLILEGDLRIHSANSSYYRVFGTTPQDTEGHLLQEVADGLWKIPEMLRLLGQMTTSGAEFANFEVNHSLPVGNESLVLNARRLPAGQDRGRMTLLAIEDVSDRKRSEAALHETEEKLRQSQRMEAIGKLAGGIAHDFNNLLTSINGYSALCLSEELPQEMMQDYLGEILKAGERAAALTRQLLAYSRKQILAPKLLDLNSVVSNMHSMLARLIGPRFQLSLALEEHLCLVMADPGQVEQVLINLVVNARDAMASGGEITLATVNLDLDGKLPLIHPNAPRGRYAELSIVDNGIGMDEEVLKRLFEPFFTTKELGKGTGLGLSVVQGIVSQSGGHILVDSTPGVGTEFKILLPRVGSGATAIPPRIEPGLTPSRRTETVLLVDDEEAIRHFSRIILERQGYTVLEAESAEAALLVLERNKEVTIQILVTDIVMPGMSGQELAEKFLGVRPESRVLLMSGYTEDADPLRYGQLKKVFNFIQKPFIATELALAMQEVLDVSGQPFTL
ncbi:MAG: ATPase [Fibrobacteres bacterium]|nr:ATPase [Fibrobacterota bacterium]